MKTTPYPKRAGRLTFGFSIGLFFLSLTAFSQTPTITVRLANPVYYCQEGAYCLDVEFLSDQPDVELFGMNVRFFYDDDVLELIDFRDFQGGYGPVSPDPPTIATNGPAGPALFNFAGPAEFVNGAIQLIDENNPIAMDTQVWTKYFQICFSLDDPNVNIDSVCPSVVWDLEQDPANGGFLIGDDGVVITIVDPDPFVESTPVFENVVQFNWVYTGPGTPPYGEPLISVCISIDCNPTITCAADITIACSEAITPDVTGMATATDICEGEITFVYSDSTTAEICANAYTIIRTWIATNDCDLSDTCVQMISLVDTIAPMIICPEDVTLSCIEEVPAINTEDVTVNDNCDTSVVISHIGDLVSDSACINRLIITRMYMATDACGNSSTCTQTITVRDEEPPSIVCPMDITVSCASEVPAPDPSGVASSDNCAATPVVIHDGDIISNQNCANQYIITRTYRSTDACGNSSTCSQLIIVDDQIPPVIVCPSDVTVSCTGMVPPPDIGAVSASDNCQGMTVVTHVRDTIVNQTCAHRYNIIRTYRATDVCGNSATCDQTITVDDQTPPMIVCPPPVMVSCASEVPSPDTSLVMVSDNCMGIVSRSHVGDVISNQTCANRYTITRTYQATDACGNTATCDQIITVNDITPPTITCPANVTVTCASQVPPVNTGSVTASDNCGMWTVTHDGDAIVNQTCDNRFNVRRTYRATDACGNTSTCVQMIVVNDLMPPSIACPANVTVSCTEDVPPVNTGSIQSTDNCGGMVLAVHLGDVRSNQTCPHRYTITRTYRVKDACWNTALCTQTITVFDGTPPAIICPDDITINAEESTSPDNTGMASATDNCAGPSLVTYDDVTIAGACMDSYTIERTWTATDACGNSSTCLQVIYIDGNCQLDLALIKTLDPGQGDLMPGDDVSFTITITNEGDFSIGALHIVDYIPVGFTLNDPAWTPGTDGSTGQSAHIAISVANGGLPPGGLVPGASVDVKIILHIDPDIMQGIYENIAEIASVYNILGVNVTGDDIDSDPDRDDTNDPEEEDDHDIAIICVLNPPRIVGEFFVCANDIVTYTVGDYDPNYTYQFSLENGGGHIIGSTPSSVTIIWDGTPGGPYTLVLTKIASEECQISSRLLIRIEDGGPMACIDHINFSIDNNCGTQVLSGLILTGEEAGNNTFQVFIIDIYGDTVPDATLTWEHVGQTFMVSIYSVCTGQSCWGFLTVEDKLPPIIDCVCPQGNENEECTITCLQLDQMINGDIPPELRPRVIDDCGGVDLEVINIDINYSTCVEGYVRITWKATDHSGNASTCVQDFRIVPISLEDVVMPGDYTGNCGESAHPSITGWPTLGDLDLTNVGAYCNLIISYSETEWALCGNGRKIIRSWVVRDWCTGRRRQSVQTIKLEDRTGPRLTCQGDIQVGTDVWNCYATVTLSRPLATDDCSSVDSYKLSSTAGYVVPNGNTVVIQSLPIGTHTATWTVKDICGNSSTCSFMITVVDNVPPVVSCDLHTVVSLTGERPNGVTLVDASSFNDGSFDNCGNVTFRARRMTSCIDFDWTTGGACVDDIPGGNPPVNALDAGTSFGSCVPFACCDVGQQGIMVELEVRDEAGNVNYCMVEVEVQDKLAPEITCMEDILVSCEFLFEIEEGIFRDVDGNNDGSLDEDPLSAVFGNIYDGFRYDHGHRGHIVINDPDNLDIAQPADWGLEGWVEDNCPVQLSVTVTVQEDCSGASFSGAVPRGAIRLIERRFIAHDGSRSSSCMQRIWVVDYKPFFIEDATCQNENPNDGVIWPCDILIPTCPDEISDTGEPIIFDDECSMVAVTYKDTRYDFADGACYKILRQWKVLDWCQFNPNTGYGLWTYTQTIKVADTEGVEFLDAPSGPVSYCLDDAGISLPANNRVFLGENHPDATSCSVHVNQALQVREACSESLEYDVKIYLFNGPDFLQIVPPTTVQLDANHEGEIRFNTQLCPIPLISSNGLPYNSPSCTDHHRILWSVEDGCGNRTYADYLFRLEDCKPPSPVCIKGLSTMIMPGEGEVTIWAKDFNASSFDDCTPGSELLFSFSEDFYQPSFTYTCDNVPEFGVELDEEIWVADAGVDHNCNGQVEWSERNKDFCMTTIMITDINNVCDNEGGMLEGEIMTAHTEAVSDVHVRLSTPGNTTYAYTTIQDGRFRFSQLPLGPDYMITPQRNDDHRNGVSTLDLVQIQKHLLGREVFTSPYQFIAADANNSKSVSAIDLIEIRKVILGINHEFPANQSWRFVRKDVEMAAGNPWPLSEYIEVFSLAGNMSAGLDFVGVKIGDVNNTAKANAFQILPRSANRTLNVKASNRGKLDVGEVIEVDLFIPERVTGFQWTMELSGLEFLGVQSDDIGINEQHTGRLSGDIVTMSWNGDVLPSSGTASGIHVTLKFKVTEAKRFIQMLDLTSKITQAEAYTAEGEILDVNLIFNSAGVFTDFALYQNKPNPWNNQTVIGFHIPHDDMATLTVYDMDGKTVKLITGYYTSGYNSITLSAADFPDSGLLYYRLDTGEYSATKKMVVIH